MFRGNLQPLNGVVEVMRVDNYTAKVAFKSLYHFEHFLFGNCIDVLIAKHSINLNGSQAEGHS